MVASPQGETAIFLVRDANRITSIRKISAGSPNQVRYVGTQFVTVCNRAIYAVGVSADPAKLFEKSQQGQLRSNPALYLDGLVAARTHLQTLLRSVAQITGGGAGATSITRRAVIQRAITLVNNVAPRAGYSVSTKVPSGTIYHSTYVDTVGGTEVIVLHSYLANAAGRVTKSYGFHTGHRINSKGSEVEPYSVFWERFVRQRSFFEATHFEIIDLYNQAMAAETSINDILTLSIVALILI
jgi:hypothetical protein